MHIFLIFLFGVSVFSFLLALLNLRPKNKLMVQFPLVSLVRPMKGIEVFPETLAANFTLNYPNFELFFCIADSHDPAIPLVEAAIVAHPQVKARLLIGDERFSTNPKLNNMRKGFDTAKGDIIIFTDSNLLICPEYIHNVVSHFEKNTGLVSAPPYGSHPQNYFAWHEAAFLNGYAGRCQLAVDKLGYGFAQGKTLAFKREILENGGFEALAFEPAEDAAATKLLRSRGKEIKILSPLYPQPLGVKTFKQIWARQVRWARLRRATFPSLYLAEATSMLFVPLLLCWFLASPLPILLWYGLEFLLCWQAKWPLRWLSLFDFMARDLIIIGVWCAGFMGKEFTWHGHEMQAHQIKNGSERI